MNWRRTSIVVALTLLPWPAVWFGMYEVRSIVWTFFLYHGLCLAGAIWGRRLWVGHVNVPTARQWLAIGLFAGLSCIVAISAYGYTGEVIVSRARVLGVLTDRGFRAGYLVPLAVYFVIVNATLEELFWRGVVLNELEYVDKRWRYAGTVWTALTFAAWHYLVLQALLEPGFAELTVAAVLGVGAFCSWLYRRTQSIVLPILWHGLVFDLAVIAVFGILVASR